MHCLEVLDEQVAPMQSKVHLQLCCKAVYTENVVLALQLKLFATHIHCDMQAVSPAVQTWFLADADQA